MFMCLLHVFDAGKRKRPAMGEDGGEYDDPGVDADYNYRGPDPNVKIPAVPPVPAHDNVVPGPRGGIEMQSVLGKACYTRGEPRIKTLAYRQL